MSFERVSPNEAKALIDNDGYVYLDVRSVPEFEAGHPEGAYNIPLLNMSPNGMKPNPRFVEIAKATFNVETKLVLGCKAGGRSKRASEALVNSGFTQIVDQRAGFEAARDAFGQITEKGWKAEGLPVSIEAVDGRDFMSLKNAAD